MSTSVLEVAPLRLPPIGVLGPYDGPGADRPDLQQLAAQMMAAAHTTIHPMYRRNPGDCYLLLLRAQALNIPVGVALDHVYVNTLSGRCGLSAQLMAAILTRAGITWTSKASEVAVTHTFFRRAAGRKVRVGTAGWTIAEAARNGLTKYAVWRNNPEDSLWARALSRGARRFFAGIVLFGYSLEEVYLMDGADETAAAGGVPLDLQVQDLLDAAYADGVTADLIRTDLIAKARKAKILDVEVEAGRTLSSALAEAWRVAAARESAAAADQAATQLGETPADAPELEADADAPAGTGYLPCDCEASYIATWGEHNHWCKNKTAKAGKAGNA
jgi:hypothetical protein